MINAEQLERAAEKLRVYDVDQGGWEQEPNGFNANATHVLLHLASNISANNFGSSQTVKEEIAPDSLQYGLRLLRWTGQVANRALPTRSDQDWVNNATYRFGGLPKHQGAFLLATSNLACFLHETDHKDKAPQVDTPDRRARNARDTGRLLAYSAMLQADAFNFDLAQAFDDHLVALRERFGISEPAG